ncbi:serine/threonine-protein kinase [Pirellulales bacterium]|nr:serine/threonine-protein kinase [Pirellulales bacterium]
MAGSLNSHSVLEQAGLASGLLTEEQIDGAWHQLIRSNAEADCSLEEVTDAQLADVLVELEYLNRWQAVQLQQGRTKFTLGPYQIVDTIGYGGMGYVFKCEHTLLGRIEAIKVLPRTQMDEASLASFLREIRSQAQLDHPNLVRLSFADRDGDTYYLVTEFVPGSDLRKLIRNYGPLNVQHAALVVADVAAALDHAHQRGLVHRDIKPGNLLITPEGRTKLTDLGLAAYSTEIADNDNDSGNEVRPKVRRGRISIVGTPDYIAPESILTPSDVRPVSDVYSLGCTFYYALTGKVPFPGGQSKDKLRRHLDQAPITPFRFASGLSAELVDLLASMMEKRPENRLQTATAVLEGLRPWLVDNPETRSSLGEIAAASQNSASAPA